MKLTTCAIKKKETTIMQMVATDSFSLICSSLVFCSVSVLSITRNMLQGLQPRPVCTSKSQQHILMWLQEGSHVFHLIVKVML